MGQPHVSMIATERGTFFIIFIEALKVAQPHRSALELGLNHVRFTD